MIPEPSEGLPLPGSAASLRFELDFSSAGPLEEREDPFVPLSDSGRFSRVLLGRIASGAGTRLRFVAAKVQRGSYRPGKERITNPQVDELWRREREGLDRCAGADAVARVDLGEGASAGLPVAFCKKVRKYFHPPCPRCGAALGDCRDDALLREHGLSEYSKSAVRYLFCRGCSAGPKKVFYTASTAEEGAPRGGAEVRRRGELYRDFAGLIRAGPQAREGGYFPCRDCEHRSACYPASAPPGKPIPAESLLVPLSYHEFHVLLLEALELHYDEFADLLGGASWESVRQKAVQTGGEGRARLLQGLEEAFAAPRQWLWRDDAQGRWPLEVLRLKLHLFAGLCRGLRAYHAACRQPHLDPCPSKVMVRLLPPAAAVPARWNFRVSLIGLASSHRPPPEAGHAPAPADLLFPASDADPIFLSPFARDATAGQEEAMRVSIRAVAAEGASLRLEGVAHSDRARLDRILPRDVLRIIPSTPVGSLENLVLWGIVEGREERGLRFQALLPHEGARPAVKPCDFDASVTLYRSLQAPCDLYGAGMLLFRALLVNDERDLFAVDGAVQRVLKQIALRYEGREAPSPQRAAGEVLALLKEEGEVFAPGALLHARADRSAVLPARLWSDLLLLGFRLVTSLSGFSFAAHHADWDPEQPGALMDRVLREVEELGTRVEVELLSRADRDREISEACAELMAEITGVAGGGKPA